MKLVELGKAATFINGYAFKPIDWSDKGLEIIRIQNLTKGSAKINYFEGEINPKYKVVKGDLLISWSGTLGVFEWEGEDSWLNQHIFKVVFDKKPFNKNFFKYLIRNSLIKLSHQVHGATMKHITKKKFDAFKIPLPPLAEQQHIAAILDKADALRQLNKQLIEKYTTLSQSLFLEMFGDPIINPKNWNIHVFKDVLEIRNGKNQKKVLNPNGNFPIYGSGGVMGYADDYISEANSVIIGRKGNINKPILVAEKYWHVDTAFGLNPIIDKLNFNYLFFFCLRYNFEQHNKTVTIPSLTKATLLNIKIPIPPLELQNEFAKRIQVIEQQKQHAETALQKSEDVFNALLQKAFKGEL